MANTGIMLRTLENTTELGGAFSAERWAYAGKMTLLGMVMVFAVLALLWGVLVIFQKVMSRNETKPQEPAPQISAVVSSVEKNDVSSCDDEVIAAVITSAVAAYMADENNASSAYSGGFRVVSFRRVKGGKAWNLKH